MKKHPNHLNTVEYRAPGSLQPYARNARRHSRRQVKQIADSISAFGFNNPVLISDNDVIIAGHGRVEAAKILGIPSVPTIKLSHLSQDELRAYILADNQLALKAGWDNEMLAIEFQALQSVDFDLTLSGFSLSEIDIVLESAAEANPKSRDAPEDKLVVASGPTTTQRGDMWQMGKHVLICGDAREADDYRRLLGEDVADLIFTDPPYNVPIDHHVSGRGRLRHREFAMASGEMSAAQFTAFLTETLGAAANVSRNGAIAYVFMDWRHMKVMLAAGDAVFGEPKQLCVWNKTNVGLGNFYRSKHELVFVFKVGEAPNITTFDVGESGRHRNNVWDFPGVSSGGADRQAALAMHPTVKPVAMIVEAIKDSTRRGSIVLDPFGGSGSTLIAAEKCGRIARLMEIDPAYCDTIVRRWQTYTGKEAILYGTNAPFDLMGPDAQELCA